jgi:hypothetical protein
MRYSRSYTLFIFLLFSVVTLVIYGCGPQKINVQDILNQPIKETGHFNLSKKYIKAGITVVYLTGSPYEIGLAHGKLCRKEILEVNRHIFEYYEKISHDSQSQWLTRSRRLEKHIPTEYIEEMRGLSEGAGIEYDKILFLNTVSTISQGNRSHFPRIKNATFSEFILTVKATSNTRSLQYLTDPI